MAAPLQVSLKWPYQKYQPHFVFMAAIFLGMAWDWVQGVEGTIYGIHSTAVVAVGCSIEEQESVHIQKHVLKLSLDLETDWQQNP